MGDTTRGRGVAVLGRDVVTAAAETYLQDSFLDTPR